MVGELCLRQVGITKYSGSSYEVRRKVASKPLYSIMIIVINLIFGQSRG